MHLTVNGEKHDHGGNGTIDALLEELAADPGRVAIVVNNRIVARDKRDSFALTEGDTVEVITFAGGG